MSSKRKSQPTRISDETTSAPSAALISNIFSQLGGGGPAQAPPVLKKVVDPEPPAVHSPTEEGSQESATRALELAQFEYLRTMAMNSVAQQQQQVGHKVFCFCFQKLMVSF